MRSPLLSSHPNSPMRAYFAFLWLLVAFCSIPACNQETKDQGKGIAETPQLSSEDRALREEKASALYQRARRFDPVTKIDKLVDVAHVYHDTRAGAKAWQELIFYLLDHSNDDFPRASKELAHFSRRCPDAAELLTSSALLYGACVKSLMMPTKLQDPEARKKIADEGLKIWLEVGERQCALPANANNFGVHLETGNGYTYAKRYADAERIWAKIEEFKEPATDMERAKVLLMRADLLRTKGSDPVASRALYLKVREFQDKDPDSATEELRDYVDKALKGLKN